MLNDEISNKAGEIFKKYNGFEAFECTTMEQLEVVEELLNSRNLSNIAKALSEHKPRRKHYSDDTKSYINHLKKAFELFEKYDPNNNSPIVQQYFKELIHLGLPEPMTEKEIREAFFEPLIMPELEKVAVTERIAKKISKQIINYHFTF